MNADHYIVRFYFFLKFPKKNRVLNEVGFSVRRRSETCYVRILCEIVALQIIVVVRIIIIIIIIIVFK